MNRRDMAQRMDTARINLRLNGLLVLLPSGEDYCLVHLQPIQECEKNECSTFHRLQMLAQGASTC
jgi:hypothetical protein